MALIQSEPTLYDSATGPIQVSWANTGQTGPIRADLANTTLSMRIYTNGASPKLSLQNFQHILQFTNLFYNFDFDENELSNVVQVNHKEIY